MSETINEQPNPETPAAAAQASGTAGKRGAWTRRILLTGTVLAGLVTAGAVAAGGMGRGMDGDEGGWGGWRHGGFGHHGHRGGPERVGFMVDKALNFVDATPEQTQKVKAIVDQAMTDMRAMREEMQGTREQAIELLKAPTIDRAAAEKLRVERMAAMDERSKKMVAAMLDIAETLTPEQRAKLATEIESMRQRWRGPFEK
ncbi:MAG: Spy/CpxP family protein refolding chaperone [Labrys sp. (in: a-proteobacteria)]